MSTHRGLPSIRIDRRESFASLRSGFPPLPGLLAVAAVLASLLVTPAAQRLAADEPIIGEYFEARATDVWLGPTHEQGDLDRTRTELRGDFVVLAWAVRHGEWEKQDLSGLEVAVAARVDGSLDRLEDSRLKSVVYIDEKATEEQGRALLSLARTLGKAYLENVVAVRRAPIAVVRKATGEGLDAPTADDGDGASEEAGIASGSTLASSRDVALRARQLLAQDPGDPATGEPRYGRFLELALGDDYRLAVLELHDHARCACADNASAELEPLTSVKDTRHTVLLQNHFRTESLEVRSSEPSRSHAMTGAFSL